jgi:hypothetical protein
LWTAGTERRVKGAYTVERRRLRLQLRPELE